MAKIDKFEDLPVWKMAMETAGLIYDFTSVGKFSSDRALRDQIRRAGISIFSNIAEGFERDGNKEFANFLTIAKGSCGEARGQAIFARQRNYLTGEQFELLTQKLVQTNRQISGFRTYLQQTSLKGRKIN